VSETVVKDQVAGMLLVGKIKCQLSSAATTSKDILGLNIFIGLLLNYRQIPRETESKRQPRNSFVAHRSVSKLFDFFNESVDS
jgi:hypothetical protein